MLLYSILGINQETAQNLADRTGKSARPDHQLRGGKIPCMAMIKFSTR
jgi:hypothetical protein